MLKIILNRLKPQAEKVIAEEQAGFRAGRSPTEQNFNLRILCEKYLKHPQDLCHVFIDFMKAFDRVLLAALWATMKKYNISANLIRVMKFIYDKATSAVLFNGIIGDWFLTFPAFTGKVAVATVSQCLIHILQSTVSHSDIRI